MVFEASRIGNNRLAGVRMKKKPVKGKCKHIYALHNRQYECVGCGKIEPDVDIKPPLPSPMDMQARCTKQKKLTLDPLLKLRNPQMLSEEQWSMWHKINEIVGWINEQK